MDIKPIFSSLRRSPTGAILVALQIALALAIVVNSLFIIVQRFEKFTGRKAERNYLPMQPGDVAATFADVDDLVRDVGFQPQTPIEEGVPRFVSWYRDYYRR